MYFLFIPIVLILLYSLPHNIQDYLILKPADPTIISIFLSNYTHSDLPHLVNNLGSYLIIMFLLFNIEINKRFFYLVSSLNFTVVPILSSFIIIHYFPLFPALGFSAISSAFNGYLLYSVYAYLKKTYYSELTYLFPLLLLMINVTICLIYSFRMITRFTIALIVTLFFFYHEWGSIKEILGQLILKYKQSKGEKFFRVYNFLIFCTTLAFIFSLWSLMPPEIKIGSNIVNVSAHYFGYCFGVFTPILIDIVMKGVSRIQKLVII